MDGWMDSLNRLMSFTSFCVAQIRLFINRQHNQALKEMLPDHENASK
uniref:Uncharacterized protein n=1 Tax=Anguilla anguilla TaxID=7936 RepID=A0A0E9UB00_ANGAN